MLLKQPYLEPYHGPASRHTCPACRKPRCFTRYLDGNTGRPIHPTVGRCNHEIHCGYHYPPRQYFADHPELSSASPNRHPQSSSKTASAIGHPQSSSKQSSTNGHPQSSSKTASKLSSSNLHPESSSRQSSTKLHPESSSKPEPLHISAPLHLPKAGLYPAPARKSPERLDLIPLQYLIDSTSFNSNFVRFLCDYFPRER
ncbi:MAG TPA: PG0870-related protein, partial [Proteiniphilum sp.]|nr:PG0870-related protein [Proteiniphilum sp.]